MKHFKIFVVVFLFLFPVFSFAQVYVNEIMYDSPGADDDWVEIYNSGSDSVTITTGSGSGSWRFVDTGAHTLVPLVDGNNVLAPGSYAIITNDTAKFSSDWPAFTGVIFKSSFSLTNTSNTIFLKDSSGTATDPAVSYASTQGAKGDGNSLQRQTDGTWIPATPTPGLVNSNVVLITTPPEDLSASSSDQTDEGSASSQTPPNTSAHSSPAPLSDTENKIEFEISAGRNRLTTVGNKLIFQAVPTKVVNVSGNYIAYSWSFGDGSTVQGNNVSHTYKFPGEYSVVVTASYSDKQAVSRLSVKVISPDVSLAKVPGGIEFLNKSKLEINLEGWSLVSAKKTFVFPIDTLISSGNKITFADDTTGIYDETMSLFNPLGKELVSIKPTLSATPAMAEEATFNLDDIQAKINEVKTAVAKISPMAESSIAVTESVKEQVNTAPTEVVASVDSTAESADQSANAATVFEATQKKGFISTVFSWPIAGFNFVRRLFVEE